MRLLFNDIKSRLADGSLIFLRRICHTTNAGCSLSERIAETEHKVVLLLKIKKLIAYIDEKAL